MSAEFADIITIDQIREVIDYTSSQMLAATSRFLEQQFYQSAGHHMTNNHHIAIYAARAEHWSILSKISPDEWGYDTVKTIVKHDNVEFLKKCAPYNSNIAIACKKVAKYKALACMEFLFTIHPQVMIEAAIEVDAIGLLQQFHMDKSNKDIYWSADLYDKASNSPKCMEYLYLVVNIDFDNNLEAALIADNIKCVELILANTDKSDHSYYVAQYVKSADVLNAMAFAGYHLPMDILQTAINNDNLQLAELYVELYSGLNIDKEIPAYYVNIPDPTTATAEYMATILI
jgi:hypothetical protein